MKKFSRSLKMVGIITLFFFTWSYLPLFHFVTYAATQDKQTIKAQPQKAGKQQFAEKLEKLLDDLKADTSKAEGKAAQGEDTSSEVESIKARKAEIAAVDADLKKEFAATEQKLKSANLSKDILARHYKFVESYENNLAELKANLDSIEKAKTPSALTSEIVKTQKHLAKIRPLKKKKVLDPNKLPNRIVKAKERQPKLKKEDWEKALKKESKKYKTAFRTAQKPILVASNGPLTGLLSGSVEPENNRQLANQTIDSIFINAAIDYYSTPAPEDMQETPETHITDAIRAKAAELQNKPVTIFSWLTNNIEYVPSYGSIQGADMCLQSKQCNDVDIASLAIALFRAAGFHARYEFATVEQPIEKFMNSVGGFTDPNAAITFVASGGVPIRPVITGGKITAVQFEHVYASAWVPYGNYRGTMMDNSNPIWLPLDFAVKYYTYTPGIDLKTAVPFDAQTFVNQIQSTATINQTDSSVTNVNSALVQQTMQDYQTQAQNYIQQNYPNATVGDIIGKRDIIQQKFHFLPSTPMLKPVVYGGQSHTLPDSMLSSISFNIPDPTGATSGLSYTTSLPQIAGKKITFSFSPASPTDQAVVESYLPKAHSDETPIQPNELPSSLPAYLINLKAELRIAGQIVATGAPVTMGSALSFTMTLNEPGIGVSNIDNVIQAGEYYGIGLDIGGIGDDTLRTINGNIASTRAKLDAKDFAGLSKENLIGDLLHMTITNYFAELDMTDQLEARANNLLRYRAPSIGLCSMTANVRDVFGVPTSISYKGMMMDVDRVMQAVFSKDGTMESVKRYMLSSGVRSSTLEHLVPEELFSRPSDIVNGISAVKALQLASETGIPIFSIDQSNVNSILPQLTIGSDVKSAIANAVNAGKEVTVSKTNITFNGSSICGYVIIDPITNAGAYMLSSGTSGGVILESNPPGGMLIVATIDLILNSVATEAAAEELEPTYYYLQPPASCSGPAYLHTGEYISCIGNAFSENLGDIAKMLSWGLLGAAYRQNPAVGFSLTVVSAIMIEVWAINTAAKCRQDAIHCDLR